MVNKQELKNRRRKAIKNKDNVPELSENQSFLLSIFNNTKQNLIKANQYVSALHHDLKIIKQLIEEVN